jgi:hypothetical protein
VIDQRILIPAPVHLIWPLLADPHRQPQWRIDCQTVTILTPRQFGVGMCQRCTAPSGKQRIEEITHWFEGLGFEYRLLQNRRYKTWASTVRLQAVPDGTIMQWTAKYEVAGLWWRLMDRVYGRAQQEEDMAESLRNLRRLIESLGYQDGQAQIRRSQSLQPVASIVRASTQPLPAVSTATALVQETAAKTKPRKPEGLEEALVAQNLKPSPLASTPPPEPKAGSAAAALTPLLSPLSITPSPISAQSTPLGPLEPIPSDQTLPKGMPESLKATPPQGTPKVDVSRLRYAEDILTDPNLPAISGPSESTQAIRPGLPPPTDSRDTGEISIWEAFGLMRPSQLDQEALEEVVQKRKTDEQPILPAEALRIEPALGEGDTLTYSPLYRRGGILRVRSVSAPNPKAKPLAMKGLKVRPAWWKNPL